MSALFPADQSAGKKAYQAAISRYPSGPSAPAAAVAAQTVVFAKWLNGTDPAGRNGSDLVPTLVADGTADVLDPVSNDRALAKLIRGARLVLYTDASHAFLFQDETAFVPVVVPRLSATTTYRTNIKGCEGAA